MDHFVVGVPGGPAVIVPSAVQSPARKSSFFNSGAGVGAAICAAAWVTAKTAEISKQNASRVRLMRSPPELLAMLGGQRGFVNSLCVKKRRHLIVINTWRELA